MRENRVVKEIGSPMDYNDLIDFIVRSLNKQLRFVGVNLPENEVVYLTLDMVYAEICSNTHVCPINGVTNWGGRDSTKPRGYPGWQGRIWFGLATHLGQNSHPSNAVSASGLLSSRGVYTGTGGPGPFDYPFESCLKHEEDIHQWGWDVKMFESDWPTLQLGNLIQPTQKQTPIRVGYHNPDYHILPSDKDENVHESSESLITDRGLVGSRRRVRPGLQSTNVLSDDTARTYA